MSMSASPSSFSIDVDQSQVVTITGNSGNVTWQGDPNAPEIATLAVNNSTGTSVTIAGKGGGRAVFIAMDSQNNRATVYAYIGILLIYADDGTLYEIPAGTWTRTVATNVSPEVPSFETMNNEGEVGVFVPPSGSSTTCYVLNLATIPTT